MDTVFFLASKIVWALISPDSLIVILGVSAWIAVLELAESLAHPARLLRSTAIDHRLLPRW